MGISGIYKRLLPAPPPVVVVAAERHDPLRVPITEGQWTELRRLAAAPQPAGEPGTVRRLVQDVLAEKRLAWPPLLDDHCTITDSGRARLKIGREPR